MERKLIKAAINTAKTRNEKGNLRSQYTAIDRLVKRNARNDKRAWTNGIALEAQAAADTNRSGDLYKLIKKLTNKATVTGKPIQNNDGILITSKDEQLDLWADHYSSILTPGPNGDETICNCDNHNYTANIPFTTPSISELISAIKLLKNNKSPGPDNISPELLKTDPYSCAQLILPLVDDIWHNERVPDELKEGMIINIPKKGNLTCRNNWRGITLLSMVNKIITHIITSRISDILTPQLRCQQAGFRPNKSCVDHVNTLRIIVEQSVEWRSPLYLVFIDFEKAFDTLNHNVIWKALQCKGVPLKLINLIKSLYVDASCRIVHEGKLSRRVKVGTGVRQGCVMSPLLFNIVLDIVMKQCMVGNRGISWGLNGRLEDLEYADDICLLSHRFSDMQSKLQLLSDMASNAGLKINIRKTKVMRINAENNSSFTIGNDILEDVESFCYLGSILTTTGGSGADISHRIKKASQTFGQLNYVWKSSTLSRGVKIKLFNSNVRSTLLYGCETWNAAPPDIQAMQVFINRCLRRILRVYWPQRITNERLWFETQQSPITVEVRRRKWNWIGHTIRKTHPDIAKSAIEWNPQGSRRRGRPAHTWRRQVIAEATTLNTSWSEVKNIAMDRSKWRDFVGALCSL